MPPYIALLLGINVSGQKVIKMTDLKELFSELSGAGKETTTLFLFSFLSSPLIPDQFDLGLPIALCLPETFNSKYLFFDPSPQTLCEEILCQS